MGPLRTGLAGVVVVEFAAIDVHTNDLNLDIDLDETLAERVDLDQTGVDSAIEATELGDQAYITLRDRFVGVRAEDAAGDRTHCSNT